MPDNFYTVISKDIISEDSFSATVSINENHDIFNGHFPGNPIVPGVCMLQIVKGLLEAQLHKKIQLQSIANVKFITVINPAENHTLDILVSYETPDKKTYKINSTVSSKEIVFLKILNAVYF